MRGPAQFSGRRWRSPSRQSKLTRAPVEGIAVGEAGFHKPQTFKYASLENIICLTPSCSGTPAAATQSEYEELQIALQTKNSDALETYWQKYPETKRLVATKEGFGSGSLLDTAGNILTNWHVVKGYEYVAVIFKPTVEGKEPTRDDIKRGRVVKYDEISDLALVKVSEVPPGRSPVRLGDASEIAVGMDVHAIGHPTGEAWTYTTGVISQYRQGYEWKAEDDPIKHKADIIQTQTPINPGNSGGPLLSDSSNLIGVNRFKAGGEGLNFAVSVDEVRKFITRAGSRIAQAPKTAKSDAGCKAKQLSKFRNEKNDATVVSFDMFCTGKDTGELVTPDDKSQAIYLRLDRNGDGHADVIFFDLKRSGRWDLSFCPNLGRQKTLSSGRLGNS